MATFQDIDTLIGLLQSARETGVTRVMIDDGISGYLEDLCLREGESKTIEVHTGESVLVIARDSSCEAPFFTDGSSAIT